MHFLCCLIKCYYFYLFIMLETTTTKLLSDEQMDLISCFVLLMCLLFNIVLPAFIALHIFVNIDIDSIVIVISFSVQQNCDIELCV